MSNINKFLANILASRYGKDVRQSIHDAIFEIDKVADTAQNSATQMANKASSHEAATKKYATNASLSETNAKTYAENAKKSAEEAMATTPEGYKALVEQVGLVDIKTTTDTTLRNSKAGGLKVIKVAGNSEQKTTTGKNLLDCSGLTDKTENNITFSPIYNSNGELQYINVNGNASNNATYTFPFSGLKVGENYLLSGCSGGTSTTHCIAVYNPSTWQSRWNYDGDTSFTMSESYTHIIIQVAKGTTLNNQKFYPMIRLASETDQTYEPFTNGASPNPQYPQEIVSVGECVEMQQGYRTVGGGYISSTSRISTKNPIPCKVGDVVKVDVEDSLDVTISGIFFKGDTYTGVVDATDGVFTVPSSVEVDNFHLNINENNNTTLTPQTVGKITLTVNGKYVIPIKTYDDNGNEHTEYIYMDEPPRKVGDIEDVICKNDGAWVVERNVGYKPITFLSANKSNTLTNTKEIRTNGKSLPSDMGWSEYQYYCDKARYVKNTWDRDELYITSFCGSSQMSIRVPVDFEGEITANIQYKLVAPTSEPLDTESQKALNRLVTYDTVTHIEVDSTVQPSEIEVVYGTSKVGALALENECLRANLELSVDENSANLKEKNLKTYTSFAQLGITSSKTTVRNIVYVLPNASMFIGDVADFYHTDADLIEALNSATTKNGVITIKRYNEDSVEVDITVNGWSSNGGTRFYCASNVSSLSNDPNTKYEQSATKKNLDNLVVKKSNSQILSNPSASDVFNVSEFTPTPSGYTRISTEILSNRQGKIPMLLSEDTFCIYPVNDVAISVTCTVVSTFIKSDYVQVLATEN